MNGDKKQTAQTVKNRYIRRTKQCTHWIPIPKPWVTQDYKNMVPAPIL